MKILVTGATGFLGSRLVARLLERPDVAVTVLSRSGRGPAGLPRPITVERWDSLQGEVPASAVRGCEAVIHLAGEPVFGRWTPAKKRAILESREKGTRKLLAALARHRESAAPLTVLSASAIGYYGDRGDELLDEGSVAGHGFLADVCKRWEAAAREELPAGARLVLLRTGVVLSPEDGALKQMLLPFRTGLGGPLGDGRQWMSWIHVDDWVRLALFALDRKEVEGALNLVAPAPCANADFSKALAHALHRPALLKVPKPVLQVLLGEMGQVVLASQRVRPARALKAGFEFEYPALDAALRQLLK